MTFATSTVTFPLLWLWAFLGLLPHTSAFGIPEITAHFQDILLLHNNAVVPHVLSSTSTELSSTTPLWQAASTTATPDSALPSLLVSSYAQALVAHPLGTKISTGMILAVGGDGIAQATTSTHDPTKQSKFEYDAKRAGAFCAFDGCYRAVQHVTYPPMMAACHGQFLLGVMGALGISTTTNMVDSHSQVDPSSFAAAMEQTLVSQLVIIPLLYYPVFYAVTGLVQGLSAEQTIQRARDTFVPLMKRNLFFWIPVQFLVFGFVTDINLQIPILSVCGLVWTMILSAFAGSVQVSNDDDAPVVLQATAAAVEEEQCVIHEEVYCITGMEESCLIDPEDLFHPAVTIQCPNEEKHFLHHEVE